MSTPALNNRRSEAALLIAQAQFDQDRAKVNKVMGLPKDSGGSWDDADPPLRQLYLEHAEPMAEAVSKMFGRFTGYPMIGRDETMEDNVAELTALLVGRQILDAKMVADDFYLTLDNGTRVIVKDRSASCCASTMVDSFLRDPQSSGQVITGIGPTDDYDVWHIFGDAGDILNMYVEWSPGGCGESYGFTITVETV